MLFFLIGQSFVKSIGVFPGSRETFSKTRPVVKGLILYWGLITKLFQCSDEPHEECETKITQLCHDREEEKCMSGDEVQVRVATVGSIFKMIKRNLSLGLRP